MNYRSKYIIIDTGSYALPVVFSELATHADVARALGAQDILGAGFCYIQVCEIKYNDNDTGQEPRYVCYGESVSLKVKSRPEEDARILNKYLGVVHEDY